MGYLSSKLWTDGGRLLASLAVFLGTPWLKMDGMWGAPWTRYISPLCILLGLALTLVLSRWARANMPGMQLLRIGLLFGLYYGTFAGWNLFATWPFSAMPEVSQVSEIITEPLDGWQILWPFVAIMVSLLALALIVRRSEQQSGVTATIDDFSASRSWVLRDTVVGKQTELLDWLLEQAIQARWRMPAVVSLANASQEIITFLQRTLPDGSAITVKAILRKNKAVMTISHEGRPLTLPDYKAAPDLDAADDALEGIELRLAAAQVEHMSYQARLSELICSFTLRQTC
jgi:hypothetical protein